MQEKVSSREADLRGRCRNSGHLLGDGVCHDDGDGVVGCGDVHGADQQSHAQLAALLSLKDPADSIEQRLKAAAVPGSGQHR